MVKGIKFNYFTIHMKKGENLIGSARVIAGSTEEMESLDTLFDSGFVLKPVTEEEYYSIEKKWSV